MIILVKGLYAKTAEIRPATFQELVGYLERERNTLYLDGPNDVDWIFRNEVLSSREEMLYVDLVATDGALLWLTPARYDMVGFSRTSGAVRLVASLMALGCGDSHVLEVIAAAWAVLPPTRDPLA